MKRVTVITRAIFVLTGERAGELFLRVLPALRAIGLSEAMILHLVSARKGPAEPMPELATWIRHFESAIPKVELALKRGDAVKWIYELARVRDVDLVVISGAGASADWDLGRVSSPLRSLGIPILYLPDVQLSADLGDRIMLAIKTPEALDRVAPTLVEWFGAGHVEAVHVTSRENGKLKECAGVTLHAVRETKDVATTLCGCAAERKVSLVTLLADDDGAGERGQHGIPVVGPLLDRIDRPVLIWPTRGKPARR